MGRWCLLLCIALSFSCGSDPRAGVKQPSAPFANAGIAGAPSQPAPVQPTQWDHSHAKIPVTSADPIWGEPDAPVTMVVVLDLECPFCKRVTPTLQRLRDKYGPNKLRMVFLHNPLPFHSRAYAAAMAAATVNELSGSRAFVQFTDLALENQSELSDESFVKWAAAIGVDVHAFRERYASRKLAAKVDADIALAKKIGAFGVPAFRINGLPLSGAQPVEKFETLIDQQLAEAMRLLMKGVRPLDVYVALTEQNYRAPGAEPEPDSEDDEPSDTTVWKVPVFADDPTRGPSDAPVTIVEFCDFECPFCKRVQETLTQIREHYRDDVRIVWKDHPLPFHQQAVPAAVLARLVLERRGNAAFFTIHDRLFDTRRSLNEETLKELATEYRIPWADVQKARTASHALTRVEASSDLANDFQAPGTPSFFINGVKLSGAQPLEKFQSAIDAQLAKATSLTKAGTARNQLYRALTQDGKEPPAPEKKQAPLPALGRPSLGPPNAPIVIQQWSDFECPFCLRVQPTLEQLRKEFPNQIRIVWRHMPLPFHSHASVAAEIAEEVLAQKGNQAFWAFHDRAFGVQDQPDGLSEANLTQIAVGLGVDEKRQREALAAHRHRAAIDSDAALADSIGIHGTPAFVINGYFVSGAQPIAAFRRAIRRALADQKSPPRR